jgi:hypothetical protein
MADLDSFSFVERGGVSQPKQAIDRTHTTPIPTIPALYSVVVVFCNDPAAGSPTATLLRLLPGSSHFD